MLTVNLLIIACSRSLITGQPPQMVSSVPASPTGAADKPTSPLAIQLEPTKIVPRDKMMSLRLTVTSQIDAVNAEVFFELPEGVVKSKGQQKQQINLVKDVPQTFELQIQFIDMGIQKIVSGVTIQKDGRRLSNFAFLMLDVSPIGITVQQGLATPTQSSEQQTQPITSTK